ncbi:MAG: hypothetical protein ACJ8DC_18650 [Gemmatimonadales bacterium]
MSVSYAFIVADNVLPPSGPGIGPSVGGAAEYEAGHSERQVTGWVAVSQESRWVATMAVAMTGDQSALIVIEREGPTPDGAPDVPEVSLVVPAGELEALLTLLRGIVAQARRDGVVVRRRGRGQDRLAERPGPAPQ